MIVTVLKVIGGLIAVAILLFVGLSSAKGTPSTETTNKNILALAYLEKNKDSYAKCANSIGGDGDVVIGIVVTEKLHDYPLDKLNGIADNYKAQIKQQCEKPVAEYKESYATFEQTEKDIAKATESLLDKITNTEPKPDSAKLRAYDPSIIKFMSGNPFENLVFTKADVEQYFNSQL